MMSDVSDFSMPYRVDDGRKFRLKDFDPANTVGIDSKKLAIRELPRGVERLIDLQGKLYAQDRWALLVMFQAMDAAGKDSAIKHVMSGVNPQGCQVYSFKQPSAEELDHDYLWRDDKFFRARGHIGIFNRPTTKRCWWYVYTANCSRKSICNPLETKHIWKDRFEDISSYERYLTKTALSCASSFSMSPRRNRSGVSSKRSRRNPKELEAVTR